MENKEYYTLEDIIRMDAKMHIKKALEKYGIIETKKLIKRVYQFHPKAIKYMLGCYREILDETNINK